MLWYNWCAATAIVLGIVSIVSIQLKHLVIYTFCRDCPSYLASTKTVCDLLLPAETAVHDKWLPAESVPMTLLPAEVKVQYDGQSWQEAKIGRLVYTLWSKAAG